MSFVVSMLAGSMALAADRQTLVWDLAINGQKVGRRSLVIKHVPTPEGVRRIMEVWTEEDGQVGLTVTTVSIDRTRCGRRAPRFSPLSKTGQRAKSRSRPRQVGW